MGPIFQFPTATGTYLGTGRWSAGPTAALIYSEGPWFNGVLAYHLMSFAGDRDRGSVNQTFIEPELSYNLESGWSVDSNPSITFDWTADSGNGWAVPMEADVGKAFSFGTRAGATRRRGTAAQRHRRLVRPLAELKIPPTVQAILASRIDRLPPDAKDLLQTLAVLGREFPTSLIRAVVTKSDDELNRTLNDLQVGEFIYEQPAVGDTEYTLKHALTQEVAYNSVLVERRKLLHQRAGDGIKALFAEQLDDHLDELARHYSHSPYVTKAVKYLQLAGQQDAQRSAYTEAVNYLTRGLEMLRSLQDDRERAQKELELQLALAESLRWTAVRSWY